MMSVANGISPPTGGGIGADDLLVVANLWTTPGILITILLLAFPVLLTVWLIREKVKGGPRVAGAGGRIRAQSNGSAGSEAALTEAGGGLLRNVDEAGTIRLVPPKKQSLRQRFVHPPEARMILWYLGTAAF